MKVTTKLLLLFSVVLFTACSKEDIPEKNNLHSSENLSNSFEADRPLDAIPGEYLILFKNDQTQSLNYIPTTRYGSQKLEIIEEHFKQKAQDLLVDYGMKKESVVKVFTGPAQAFHAQNLSTEDAKKLKSDPRVLLIEPNYLFTVIDVKDDKPSTGTQRRPCNLQTEPSGDSTFCEDRIVGYTNVSGLDRAIFILDDGIKLHPDLRIERRISYNAYPTGTYFDDTFGYGTQIAGTIAAKQNGFGAIGVAAGAKIGAIKVQSRANGATNSIANVIDGINFVYNHSLSQDVFFYHPKYNINYSIFLSVYLYNLSNHIVGAIGAGNENRSTHNISPASINTNRTWIVGSRATQLYGAYSVSNYGESIDCWTPRRSFTTNLNSNYTYAHHSYIPTAYVAGILLARGDNTIGTFGSVTKNGFTAPKAFLAD